MPLRELWRLLWRKPYLDDSLVIVTSDHGELLGDGGLGHGYFLRDGLLRVPLWVKWPS
jgi:arylsulfatase A-like enzyme